MSAPAVAAPPKRRPFFRFWFPFVVLALVPVAIAVYWAWPNDEWERSRRVWGTVQAVFIGSALVLLWFLGLSGIRWSVRLVTLLAVSGVAWGSVKEVRWSGDMVPHVVFRWEQTPDDALDNYRKEQADAAPAAPARLTEQDSDFPEYQGRRRDGVVQGPPLARDWQARPVWKPHACGGGYAGFAVAGNLAVTIEQRRDQEAVVGYDTDTGRERWAHAYSAHFKEPLGGPGPRATPTISGGYVFSLGAAGRLVCLEAVSGEEKWSADILKDNSNVMWGMSGSPLVYDGLVVVNPGCQGDSAANRALVAYDRKTGKEVWSAGSAQAGYSSPMLATLGGKRQIVLLDGEGVAGYDATGGQELWRFPWQTHMKINVAQPLVLDGDRVFISSGYGVGCAMLQVTEKDGKWSATPLWQKKTLRCKFTSPVLRAGYIYGLDEGILTCVDVKTGERKWRDGRYGHGQLLLSGDLLVILSESGKLAAVEATSDRFRELGSFQAVRGKTWNCFALVNGKAFVRNDREMACFDLK
jgi:outer membrane protein assembly factor BamB